MDIDERNENFPFESGNKGYKVIGDRNYGFNDSDMPYEKSKSKWPPPDDKIRSKKIDKKEITRFWQHLAEQAISASLIYVSVIDYEKLGIGGQVISDLLSGLSGDFKLIIPMTISITIYEIYRSKARYTKLACIVAGVTYSLTSGMIRKIGYNAGIVGDFIYLLADKTLGVGSLNIFASIIYAVLIALLLKRIKELNLPALSFKKNTLERLPEMQIPNFNVNLSKKSTKTNNENANRINTLFEEMGIEAKVSKVIDGNTVIRYEIERLPGTKLNEINRLSNEIAAVLKVDSVLMPTEQGILYVEVAKENKKILDFGRLLKMPEFISGNKFLLPIGQDIQGNIKYFDFREFPHLLIGGATGGGKSVLLNVLITSIIKRFTPDELKLILIDPKRVEFALYEETPFLYTDIVNEPYKAVDTLKILVDEMEQRYTIFAKYKKRNIKEFNKEFPDKKIPYLVAVIDELADLMMVSGKSVEESVQRLSQKARAAGIHLIVATQRPSADVITGNIKANLGARIALSTVSNTDSRIILDKGGAELLSGKGDMLFSPVGLEKPERLQGVNISDEKIEKVILDSIEKYGTYQENIKIHDSKDDTDNIKHASSDDVIDIREKMRQMSEEREEKNFAKKLFKHELTEEALIWAITESGGKISQRKISDKFKITNDTAKSIQEELIELGAIEVTSAKTSPNLVKITLEEWETMKIELMDSDRRGADASNQ